MKRLRASARPQAVQEDLSRTTLLRLIGLYTLISLPHVVHLPIWCSAIVAVLIGWRALIAWKQWRLPSTLLRGGMAFAAFAVVYGSYGEIKGQTAGVALLAIMGALKMLELRQRRDLMFMVMLMYFILITHFLFTQELWTFAYMLGSAVLITGLLTDVSHGRTPLPWRESLRLGGVMIAQALPLMLVLFVLFPRIPGPLWGVPADSGSARSGLSDSMAPGDIAHLIESDAVAFRARFDGEAPANRLRYWRGPIFDQFDGRRWSASGGLGEGQPNIDLNGTPINYEIVMEPNNQHWLFALDLVDPSGLAEDIHVNAAGLLWARNAITERRLYRLRSYPSYKLDDHLSPTQRNAMLRIPPYSNLRTQALARQWRDTGLDDEAIVRRALSLYREENFAYTLNPPPLANNPVDDFLFNTKRGFCEHYASSFTVLMRAAGIPARIVTGYQGGDRNEIGGYYIVRQSDAHAWSEVWLHSRGWVRVDPTAAVAPERIEAGISRALRGSADLPAFLDPSRRSAWREGLEARWDWVNAQWNRWVLAYGPNLQQDLLGRFGLHDWRDLMLATTAALAVLLAVIGAFIGRGMRNPRVNDAALRAWQRLLRRLQRIGLHPQLGEGPQHFAERVAQTRPDLAAALRPLFDLYLRQRYLAEPDAAAQKALEHGIAQLRI